jgi:hypothetical protein
MNRRTFRQLFFSIGIAVAIVSCGKNQCWNGLAPQGNSCQGFSAEATQIAPSGCRTVCTDGTQPTKSGSDLVCSNGFTPVQTCTNGQSTGVDGGRGQF